MKLNDTPIRKKLMAAILLTSGAVLLVTCGAFFAYEFFTFRQTTVRHLSTLGEVVAANSTASLSFDNQEDAAEVLGALRAERHIVAAGLYDGDGKLFAKYPATLALADLPAKPGVDGYRFSTTSLTTFLPVMLADRRVGTLYLRSTLDAMYARLELYSGIVALVVGSSFLIAYLLSRSLQAQISRPILALAESAQAVSERQDYSVRVAKQGEDEVGRLTDAFNRMLSRIEEQNQALRASEERFRLMVAAVTDYSIIMLDPTGRVASWNAGAERIKGFTEAEILGQSFSCFYTPGDVARGEPARLLAVAASEGRVSTEGWRRRRDGSEFWANVVITALRDESGELRGFSKVTRDVTERRRAQIEIQTLNQELEQRVVQRTSQLQAANAELEAFTYSVSHDLRAPLRHIDGFASMLTAHAMTMLDEKGRRYLGTISNSARRMGQLIDDLLEFSRMGRAELRHSRVDLNALVGEVRESLRAEMEGRTIQWHVAPLPEVTGDVALLRQVFVNLLGNAVKYTRPRPEARIEIGARNGSTEEVVVFVRDNGAGFDPKYTAKLFGVFQRLHSSSEFEGTGVGLANVRRIVQRHGGRTWAEGRVGEGAAFFVSLPLYGDSQHPFSPS